MKTILKGIVLFCFLAFARGARTVQAAAVDDSDHFVSLKIDNKKAWFNDDFIHVQAKFSDRKQPLVAGSVMKITWKNSRDAFIQGIDENKKLVIQDEEGKDHEVGQYTVGKDGAFVLFNYKIEDFKNVTGQVDFDLQVKNKSEKSQDLLIQAGDINKTLHIVGQNAPNKDIGSVTIDGNYNQNTISWEINIKPDKAEYAQIIVRNIIPEGLILDDKSLKIKVADQEIKLDKDDFQISGNSLKLNFKDEYRDQPIDISYDTKMKSFDALSSLNQVVVRYMLQDDETINENIYGGKVQNELTANIVGETIKKKVEENNTQNKRTGDKNKEFLNKLNALISEKKKQELEPETKKQNSDLKITAVPTTSLTGFDAKPTTLSVPKTKSNISNDDLEKITDKTLDDDDFTAKKSNDNHYSSRNKLPKAGESISIILSIVGGCILIISGLIWSMKRKAR